MRRWFALVIVLLIAGVAGAREPAAQRLAAPLLPPSLKFAVIGDGGDGTRGQYDIATRMAEARTTFPFEFVISVGDNMYGSQEPKDFVDKFERPYRSLLAAGVPFYAVLGNHDNPDNRLYPGFHMDGQRYYSFVRQYVRFVGLDTNLLDPKQVAWFEETLRGADEPWKVVFFHHALYSNADRHGSNVELRVVLEPLLVRYGVSVVLSGHDHVYERIVPQKGITYFVEGSSGKLRKGDLRPSPTSAAGFDQDQTFMIVEIAGDRMTFRTISRTGATVDSGVVERRRPTT